MTKHDQGLSGAEPVQRTRRVEKPETVAVRRIGRIIDELAPDQRARVFGALVALYGASGGGAA